MKTPQFQVGDRVRIVRTGPDHTIIGVVKEVDTRTLSAQTTRGPRYLIEVNGLDYGWLHELDLTTDGENVRPSGRLA